MSDDVTGHGTNQPPQRPMWQVQPGPVTGPFSPPPASAEGQPGQRVAQPDDGRPQHLAAPAPQQTYPQQGQQPGQQPGHQDPDQHQGQQHYDQHDQQQPPAPLPGPGGGGVRAAGRARASDDRPGLPRPPAPHPRHRPGDVGLARSAAPGHVRAGQAQDGRAEREYREARAVVQRSFSGPRTIVFANPKGGAAKTTSVLAAGYTFGTIRGGGVVAWDNNETRGTLGIRGERGNHQNTTRELLDDLQRFRTSTSPGSATSGRSCARRATPTSTCSPPTSGPTSPARSTPQDFARCTGCSSGSTG